MMEEGRGSIAWSIGILPEVITEYDRKARAIDSWVRPLLLAGSTFGCVGQGLPKTGVLEQAIQNLLKKYHKKPKKHPPTLFPSKTTEFSSVFSQ